jgi:hypothetical protein
MEELIALSVIKGKLQQKYDINLEFTDTAPFSVTKIYGARDRVVIDFPVYDATKSYLVNDLVVQTGTGYICTAPTTGAFDNTKWTSLGAQYTIYYAAYPSTCTYPATLSSPNAPMFDYTQNYQASDIVFWKGYTYQCITPTINIKTCDLIQYYVYSNVPFPNIFPDDLINNSTGQYWSAKTAYTFPAGTLPTDTTYWIKGDNREQQIVQAMKAIVIYNLSPLIAPQNAPKLWEKFRDESVYAIDQMAKGMITVDIPVLQPMQGRRIRSGGNVKQSNRY